MKIIFGFLLVCLVFVSNAFADEVWQPVSGIKESDIKEIAIGGGIIYASSEKSLYRSEDNGETWRAVFFAKGDKNAINFISISEDAVFVCTEKGVFRSLDGRSSWKRVFKGIGTEENRALHIAFSKDKRIYLGTRAGLFVSNDNGLTWKKDPGEAGNISVKWIALAGEEIFLATETGVYKKTASGWKRAFVTQTEESKYDSDLDSTSVSAIRPVNSIFIKEGVVFLATDAGIFASDDKGKSWNRFTLNGLLSQRANRVLFKDNLYAATDKGIFIFNDKDKNWKALYKGMAASKVQSIAEDDKGNIWVATDKGLYRSQFNNNVIARHEVPKQSKKEIVSLLSVARNDTSKENILELFDNEPTIREVQSAAIKYAEVYPDKIKNWRRRAKTKAFLPELSIDYDKTINYDSGGDKYYTGPYDWGVSAKWDLGEIVWNKDQTSIDVRSKLMVQLRDDILDETTRTYFERRRLQIETHFLPPEDLKTRMEKELRMQELTADLDALTGGYFSENMHK